MRHFEAGGSALLLGERFSISPRQSSKTFAENISVKNDVLQLSGVMKRVLTDICIILCTRFDPSCMVLFSQSFTFRLFNLTTGRAVQHTFRMNALIKEQPERRTRIVDWPWFEISLCSNNDTRNFWLSTEVKDLVVYILHHIKRVPRRYGVYKDISMYPDDIVGIDEGVLVL